MNINNLFTKSSSIEDNDRNKKFSFSEYCNKEEEREKEKEKFYKYSEKKDYVYIENYVFFTGEEGNKEEDECSGSYLFFSEEDKSLGSYIFEKETIKDIKDDFGEETKIVYQIVKEKFGTFNFRLFIFFDSFERAHTFDFDSIDFEKEMETIISNKYTHKNEFFQYGFSKNSNKKNFEDSYLFHQHLYKINEDKKETKKEIKWSTYRSFTLNKEDILYWLDLDTLILRTHTYYRVFNLDIITLLKNPPKQLKAIRKLQNYHRYYIAKNLDRYNYLSSKAVEEIDDITKIHRLSHAERMYTRLETNLNEQVNRLEVDRENNSNFINGIILGILAVLGIFGVFSSIFSIIKDIGEVKEIIETELTKTEDKEYLMDIYTTLEKQPYGEGITLIFYIFLAFFTGFILQKIYSSKFR